MPRIRAPPLVRGLKAENGYEVSIESVVDHISRQRSDNCSAKHFHLIMMSKANMVAGYGCDVAACCLEFGEFHGIVRSLLFTPRFPRRHELYDVRAPSFHNLANSVHFDIGY